MKLINLKTILIACVMAGLIGCKRNPIERLSNPIPDSTVPGFSGTFTIYDDELKTGGDVGFIPFGESQSIDFGDKTSPRRSTNQIRYVWTGSNTSSTTAGAFQHDFAGFSLFVRSTGAESVANQGLNLDGLYTTLHLWVRGSLSEGNTLRIEGPDDGNSATTPARAELTASQLAAGWREINLPIPNTDLQDVRVFMTVSIQYDQPPRTDAAGNGGTVFLDDIRYE